MVLAAFMIALAVLAGLMVCCAAARWWHVAVILLGALPLFPLIARSLTGDLSRDLPEATFAAGAEGKDQIILVSAYATIAVAIRRRTSRSGSTPAPIPRTCRPPCKMPATNADARAAQA